MLRTICLLLPVAALLASTPLHGDDVRGAQSLLCSVSTVHDCYEGDTCYSALPWEFNVPRFIVIDLDEKKLKTTVASKENRETPIKNLEREDGLIIIQGAERGRAFSIVITEETGLASLAVATSALNISAFGACTPMPD